MNLMKWKKPKTSYLNKYPVSGLQNEINSLFDSFFDDRFDSEPSFYGQRWPTVEVKEKKDEYKIKLETPGMSKDDINLYLNDNILEISGERRNEKEEDKDGTYYSEMSYGSFYRTIPFEKQVDAEKIKAKMKDGILKIEIAKAEPSNPNSRQIHID